MSDAPPSISVCMATYNGTAYLKLQLISILSQLRNNDELVLVDDHSSDATLELVNEICDKRIHVYQNHVNLGVQLSFERAISLASGDLIFLSDQDDLWHPNKIANYIDVFTSSPEVTLVLSDARIVDKNGALLVDSFFATRGCFKSGVVSNLIKNKYLGCVMAFRRELLSKILPFPSLIPQHDMWIGLINGVYGKAHFISQPLIDYRRHDTNASLASYNKRGHPLNMIKWRLILFMSLIHRIFRNFYTNFK